VEGNKLISGLNQKTFQDVVNFPNQLDAGNGRIATWTLPIKEPPLGQMAQKALRLRIIAQENLKCLLNESGKEVIENHQKPSKKALIRSGRRFLLAFRRRSRISPFDGCLFHLGGPLGEISRKVLKD